MRTVLLYIILTITLSGLAYDACAQEVGVPHKLQISLFCKALTFDRNLETRCGEELVICILFQGRYRASHDAMKEVYKATRDAEIDRVKGLPLRLVNVDLEDKNWAQKVAEQSADVVYLMPVRSIEISDVKKYARERHLLTLCADPSNLADGITLGLRLNDNRPKFVINLSESRSEGADFSSQLLGLAEVIE